MVRTIVIRYIRRIYDEKKSKSGETETVYSCTKNM